MCKFGLIVGQPFREGKYKRYSCFSCVYVLSFELPQRRRVTAKRQTRYLSMPFSMFRTAFSLPSSLRKGKVSVLPSILTVDKGKVLFNSGETKEPLPSHLDSSLSWFYITSVCKLPTCCLFILGQLRGGLYFPKKNSGGSIFNKVIVPAHDLEGSDFFRGGPKFVVKNRSRGSISSI